MGRRNRDERVNGLTPEEIIEKLDHVRKSGSGYTARCPAHDDHENSLSIGPKGDGGTLLHCFVGRRTEDIASALGLEMHHLFPPKSSNHSPAVRTRSNGFKAITTSVTVETIAAAKGLPPELFRSLGWTNDRGRVLIPYRDLDGTLSPRIHVRHTLDKVDGVQKFTWRGRSDVPILAYGLDRLDEWRRKKGRRLGVFEGETDYCTGLYADLPVLGIPGASMIWSLPHAFRAVRRGLMAAPLHLATWLFSLRRTVSPIQCDRGSICMAPTQPEFTFYAACKRRAVSSVPCRSPPISARSSRPS